jgi:hypothetical protein
MFCPQCRAEYLDGVTSCSDCHIELVHSCDGGHPGSAKTEGNRPYIFGTRDWISLCAAILIGPVLLGVGSAVPGLIYGAAAMYYFLCCAIIVPLLVVLADRLKAWAWQIAIGSLTLTVISDGIPKPDSLRYFCVLGSRHIAFLTCSDLFLASALPTATALRLWHRYCDYRDRAVVRA